MTARAPGGEIVARAPSPAVAPPPGNPRFALFDSLRALAVLAVVAFHSSLVTGAVNVSVFGDVAIQLGGLGPVLFFVISGFLLYRPYVAARAASRPRPSTLRFARRRALRIVPAYWLALTALGVFPGVVGVFGHDWWRYYGFLQLYSHRTFGGGLSVAWTLCVEASFYLALPLWAILVRRVRVGSGWLGGEMLSLVSLAAVGVGVQLAASRLVVSDLWASSLLGQSTWLATGMALAVASVAGEGHERCHRTVRQLVKRPGLCWTLAALAFAGLAVVRHRRGGLFGVIEALRTKQPILDTVLGVALTAAFLVLLVLPAVFGERNRGIPRRLLSAAPLAWLGLVSYGIYLWHLPVVQALGLRSDPLYFSAPGLGLVGKLPHAATPILFALTLTIACGAAAISYHFVELPFLRRKES